MDNPDQRADSTRSLVIEAIADVEGLAPAEIEAILGTTGGASYHLDSKTAEVVIASVEHVLGHQLPAPADLPRDQFTTFDAIVSLIERDRRIRRAS